MAQRKTGGYEIDLGDERLSDSYSASLELYVGGMMAFAYPDVRLPARDEIALLESVVRDLQQLIAEKKEALEKRKR